MHWLALIIPLLISVGAFIFFRHKIVWWEILSGIAIPIVTILIMMSLFEYASLSDTEYKNHIVTEARYYEPYDTWVHRTCYRTVKSGKTTIRVPYDCSYCSRHSASYEVKDTGGNSFSINKAEYDNLTNKWNASPVFVDLHRSISYHFSCGKDGDMYKVLWDNKIMSSEISTTSHSYQNILQTKKSAFNFKDIDEEEASVLGLYNYPQIGKYYQPSVMGQQVFNWSSLQKDSLVQQIDYLNGVRSTKDSVKVYVLIFTDSHLDLGHAQQAYWDGGNRNEIVICIGSDIDGNIEWVYPFSWNKDKELLVNLREDIVSVNNLKNSSDLSRVIDLNISKYWKQRDFDTDFSYLKFEASTGQLIALFLLTIAFSIGITIWNIKNDFTNEVDNHKSRGYGY